MKATIPKKFFKKLLKNPLTNPKTYGIISTEIKGDDQHQKGSVTMEKMTYRTAVAYAIKNLSNAPADVLEKLNALEASLEAKAHAERKPTAKQTANEQYKGAILAFMEADTLYSVSDIFKGVEAWANDETMSPARVSALLTQLKRDDVIVRVEYKRKAFFKLA
jgi:hypothetical protein